MNDLKCYKKLPLQTMAKKPDLTKSDRMWGGQMKFDASQESASSKPEYSMNTTTRSDFIGKQNNHPTLDLDHRVKTYFKGELE